MNDEGIALLAECLTILDPQRSLGARVTAYLAQHAPPTVEINGRRVNAPEAEITEFVEDYEFYGEDASGREGYYTPNERERTLIEDALNNWEAQGRDDAIAAGEAMRDGGGK